MGSIINPRGTSGSGKTELARRILADYGWTADGRAHALHRPGRDRPIGYRLKHPSGGAPLVVLGHYEKTSGGCDTIRAADGGLEEIYRLADMWAADGHDVLLEGSAWSAEHIRSAALATRHLLYVLFLSTSIEQCARNLMARRRSSRAAAASLWKPLLEQRLSVKAACSKLQSIAAIEGCHLAVAHIRARHVLGIDQGDGPHAGPPVQCPSNSISVPPDLDAPFALEAAQDLSSGGVEK